MSYTNMGEKILTRSAKPVRRHATARSGTTPSNGPVSNPQLYANSDSVSNSRKRKRGSDSHVELGSNGIDFFDHGGNSNGTTHDREDAEPGAESESEEEPRAQMDVDERKRILRQHKLKVTLLDAKQETKVGYLGQRQEQKKKKKRKEGSEDKKDPKTADQIYPEPLEHFRQLGRRYNVAGSLVRNVLDQGFTLPTEVQMASLPLLLGGLPTTDYEMADQTWPSQASTAMDLLTIAPTGSGKTLAFLIPLLERLQKNTGQGTAKGSGPRAVILVPTKELVNQIVNEGRKLAIDLDIDISAARKGIHLTSPSVDDEDTASLVANKIPDIVVATPLALVHLLEGEVVANGTPDTSTGKSQSTHQVLPSVEYLILDEADVLLDPLFTAQTLNVVRCLTSPNLSISFWSATISSSIETQVQSLLSRSPHPLVRLVVGLKDSAVPNITHRLTYCATERGKLLALRDLLVPKSTPSGPSLRAPFLVFTQTIERCTALHKELKYDIPVSAGGSSRIAVLHSELPDRVRDKILTNFRKGDIWVLITTDLLARGVDFRGVNGVVNYDVPTSAAGYVHRVGRTGRAGREGGVAVTLYTKEDVKYVKVVANVIAAAEKARGKSLGDGEKGVEQWLLDALPDVSKEDRKKLKKHGVEERRKGKKEGRIETRGGWQRKADHRKRDMVGASKRAKEREGKVEGTVKEVIANGKSEDSDFGGFDD
ncbi:P-loop containing nucleoside triphosphate hydrolase protein [Elsinoe ampelina]|uniref:RNA helicase n=1 Tax=Elsinoe ampelina TaxID=302913 RepID=A0A6A6GA82_9PEZI|nr:P-loop containing nucleoside triphosphate hydrolase protein [Elsinoe ampelina]